MKKLVIATFNKHKLHEFNVLAKRFRIKAVSLEAFPHLKPPREDGKTFQENAIKKAMQIAVKTGCPALGDDSGLCVDALKGAPGIKSARYSGRKKSDLFNNLKLLREMARVPDKKRTAHYYCAIAVATPRKLIGVVSGKVNGRIAREMRGKHGFAYDSLFYYPPYRKTFAEIPLSIKNKVSHRARALKKAVKLVKKVATFLTRLT